MSEHVGPIYEVTLVVDAVAATGLDEWLAQHVDDMLQQPGFDDATISKLQVDDDRVGRVVRYRVSSTEDLDRYLAGPAQQMRQQTVDRFGEYFDASRRILSDSQPPPAETVKEECRNCGAVLTGQYCGECGQRAQSRLISIWELLKDALGDLLDFDSRIWRTLIQLAVRPGSLTRDYLQGRRARYLPPFRTYLVLSIAFFVIAFFDPREDLGIFFAPSDETSEAQVPIGQAIQDAADELQEELAAEGVVVERRDGSGAGPNFQVSIDGEAVDTNCEFAEYNPADVPAWVSRRLTRERLQTVCRRMTAEGGEGLQGFLDTLLDYVPVSLFVLLPLMALVLKVLYPLSRRYYVEHLLLVIHFHAFVFLALITQILISRVGELVRAPELLRGLLIVALAFYIPVYLYKMLRRVYQQGHWLTALKFVPLILAYWFGLFGILMTTAVIAAFSA